MDNLLFWSVHVHCTVCVCVGVLTCIYTTDYSDLCVVCVMPSSTDWWPQALVDSPCTGVQRQSMNFKQLHLTKMVVPLSHSAGTGAVRKAWVKAKIDEKWAVSTWAKKIALRKLVCTTHKKLTIVCRNIFFNHLCIDFFSSLFSNFVK